MALRDGDRLFLVFLESTCGIGLALPIEPPKAHNLGREAAFKELPL
jgi:hypothetical protein